VVEKKGKKEKARLMLGLRGLDGGYLQMSGWMFWHRVHSCASVRDMQSRAA
jgi:hypothetical protein